jgi:hypothetical protein
VNYIQIVTIVLLILVVRNQKTSQFKAWCSFENKCSNNETNCQNFQLFYLSDNDTHNSISKIKMIELLEPERNPKFHKENYWKNYKNWNFPLSCENQKFVSNVSKCPSFESNSSKLTKSSTWFASQHQGSQLD